MDRPEISYSLWKILINGTSLLHPVVFLISNYLSFSDSSSKIQRRYLRNNNKHNISLNQVSTTRTKIGKLSRLRSPSSLNQLKNLPSAFIECLLRDPTSIETRQYISENILQFIDGKYDVAYSVDFLRPSYSIYGDVITINVEDHRFGLAKVNTDSHFYFFNGTSVCYGLPTLLDFPSVYWLSIFTSNFGNNSILENTPQIPHHLNPESVVRCHKDCNSICRAHYLDDDKEPFAQFKDSHYELYLLNFSSSDYVCSRFQVINETMEKFSTSVLQVWKVSRPKYYLQYHSFDNEMTFYIVSTTSLDLDTDMKISVKFWTDEYLLERLVVNDYQGRNHLEKLSNFHKKTSGTSVLDQKSNLWCLLNNELLSIMTNYSISSHQLLVQFV